MRTRSVFCLNRKKILLTSPPSAQRSQLEVAGPVVPQISSPLDPLNNYRSRKIHLIQAVTQWTGYALILFHWRLVHRVVQSKDHTTVDVELSGVILKEIDEVELQERRLHEPLLVGREHAHRG
uniref:Uncharacterized protein n=1 Tax=Cacopsylla melanoneura TaxID=428564 RepID=A0A8D8PSP1_9HEMI